MYEQRKLQDQIDIFQTENKHENRSYNNIIAEVRQLEYFVKKS